MAAEEASPHRSGGFRRNGRKEKKVKELWQWSWPLKINRRPDKNVAGLCRVPRQRYSIFFFVFRRFDAAGLVERRISIVGAAAERKKADRNGKLFRPVISDKRITVRAQSARYDCASADSVVLN